MPDHRMRCANALLPQLNRIGVDPVPYHHRRRRLPANPLPWRSWLVVGVAVGTALAVVWAVLR